MGKFAAALATATFAITIAGPVTAAGAQDLDDAATVTCDTVGPVVDPPVCDASDPAGPSADSVDPVLGDVEGTGIAPAPAPAPAPSPAPAPAPSSQSASPTPSTDANSSSAPTGFVGSVSVTGAGSQSGTSSGRVPSVPVGSTLNLGSLAMPAFEVTAPAASVGADRAIAERALQAATAAAAADALPDDGQAMAVLVALGALLLVVGLHADHRRKTHHVIPT